MSPPWVDFRRFEALKRGARLDLTREEFGLLRVLAAPDGQVVTRDDLLNDVWGYGSYPSTRTIDTHIGHCGQNSKTTHQYPGV